MAIAINIYDPSEARDPAEREAALMAALPQIVAAAQRQAPAYRERLAGIRADAIDSRRALADLPLTRKSELIEVQRRNPPFGGFSTVPTAQVARVFASPGPIYEIEARRPDFFRMARALYAAGFRAGDLIHNTFSYHLTPAGRCSKARRWRSAAR
jgi:phenylacetate-CoA ligase